MTAEDLQQQWTLQLSNRVHLKNLNLAGRTQKIKEEIQTLQISKDASIKIYKKAEEVQTALLSIFVEIRP